MSENEKRKAEFVDAAEMLFKKNGIVDTTVNAIVKEMDVAKGLFYYYFKSKDDVIDAISKKYNDSFKKSITQAFAQNDYSTKLKECIANITSSFAIMWSNLHGENANIDLSLLTSKTIDEAKLNATEILKQVLQEGIDKNVLDIKNAEYYAEMIVSGISDLVKESNDSIQEIIEFVIDLIDKVRKDINNG